MLKFDTYSNQKMQKRTAKMNPLTLIYWTRALLGVVAALISTGLSILIPDFTIINGILIALLFYIITYYGYKALFLSKVDKPSKIFRVGVGVYFLTWIVTFGIFFTLTAPVLVITSPQANTSFSPRSNVTITAQITNQFGMTFSGANVTATTPAKTLIQLNQTSPGVYTGTYIIPSNESGAWTITVKALIDSRSRESTVKVTIQGP